MVYVLLLCHLYFNFKTKFIQRHTFKGIRYSLFGGGANTYSAFASALGTTIGPGNIIGVAVAVSAGGAGAVFWMWVCGVLAIPTKYAESYLSLKYRHNKIGGPMVLLKRFGYPKLSKLWSWLCILAGLFMGAAVPSGSLAQTVPVSAWVCGAILAIFIVLTVSFGCEGISKIASYLVPVMSVGFLLICAYQMLANPSGFCSAVSKILSGAFCLKSAVGGGMAAAVKSGVTRGLYSNESGLGSGGVLAAEADDDNTVLSALGAMTTVFWDTVVMCAVCGIVFVMGGADFGIDSKAILKCSFANVPYSSIFLAVSMSLFVYATVIGWYYIAKRALPFTNLPNFVYDLLFVMAVFFGAVLPMRTLIFVSDTLNFCMLAPSLFIIIKLSNKIKLYISNK